MQTKADVCYSLYFDQDEYLANKAEQVGNGATATSVATAIQNAGMTPLQHYERYGAFEGVNPSSLFNDNGYFQAKATQINMSVTEVKTAFQQAGLDPIEHYALYGASEGFFPGLIGPDDITYKSLKTQITTIQQAADYEKENFTYKYHDGTIPYSPSQMNTLKAGDCKDMATFFSDILSNVPGITTQRVSETYVLPNGQTGGHTFAIATDGVKAYSLSDTTLSVFDSMSAAIADGGSSIFPVGSILSHQTVFGGEYIAGQSLYTP